MKCVPAGILIGLTLMSLAFSTIRNKPVRFASSATPATWIVTKTANIYDGICDNDCSIEEALENAAAGDTIIFAAELSGKTIHLSSTLTITKDVTIDGSALASPITISGDTDNNGVGDIRVIYVAYGVFYATLNRLIITEGMISLDMNLHESGGGIKNDGEMTIINSIISNNSSVMEQQGAGGGIGNYGMMTITNSTISGNSAWYGGGIENDGWLYLNNSTVSGNFAHNAGGGIEDYGNIMRIINSTISGNSSDYSGAGIENWSSLELYNSTISNNSAVHSGGGIENYAGTIIYYNTIIANSTGGDCYNVPLGQYTGVIWSRNSLTEDGSCSAALSGDPRLGPLASNGGPTQTHALLPGSSAIDTGYDPYCAWQWWTNNLDQRGATRPQGAHCDIGSYEYFLKEMTAFSFASPAATGIIKDSNIIMTLPTGTNLAHLVSSFTTTGETVKVGDIAQVSGVTQNDFTHPVTYTVTATDGSVRKYVVTINFSISLSFNAIAAQDGWVLESSENSNVGGALNSTATAFSLGDDAAKRQFRGMLSFNTGAGIPDNATIIGVTLKVKRLSAFGRVEPYAAFQGCMFDIKNGFFGRTPLLELADFQMAATGTSGPSVIPPHFVNNVYSFNLVGIKALINKLSTNDGLTQIRMRFKLDDNNDAVANYLSLYSGNAVNVADRPQLVITYTMP